MARRKLRLEPNKQEQAALAEIKRVHAAGGHKLTPAEARKLRKRVPGLPGFKVRLRDGQPQYKGRGFGQWREHSPLAYWVAKLEAAYLTAIEKGKLRRVTGGAEARRAQGEETKRRILEAWEQSTLPEHNRAAVIAHKLHVSERHVRDVIKSTRK